MKHRGWKRKLRNCSRVFFRMGQGFDDAVRGFVGHLRVRRKVHRLQGGTQGGVHEYYDLRLADGLGQFGRPLLLAMKFRCRRATLILQVAHSLERDSVIAALRVPAGQRQRSRASLTAFRRMVPGQLRPAICLQPRAG